ncbi:MAG TPA: MFS transporter [Candidatus Methylacidiphilales bacterium]
MSTAVPLPPAPSGASSEAAPAGTWRAGTLSYTRRGLVLLSLWLLLGDFAWSMRDRAVPPVMQLLFKRFGASDMVTGLVFSTLPAALGMIIGPIVAYRSDRLRTRWGRRIPFLIVPIPFVLLALAGLASAPWLGERLHRLLGAASPGIDPSVLIAMGAFWILFDAACLTGNSVFGALVNDVVPQEVVGRFYGLFRAVSLVAGIAFFFKLMGKADAHPMAVFLAIAVLYGVGFLLMCLKVKEGEYPPPPEPRGGQRGFFAAAAAYFKDGFGNPYYLWYFAAVGFGNLATLPFNLYSFYYAQSMGLDADAFGKCIAATYACSLLLSYPLGALADRVHPLRLTLACLALYAVVMACGGLFARTTPLFVAFFILHGVASGSLFTASASLPQRLLPRAKFAEIGSVSGIIQALSMMAVAPLFGKFLDLTHHAYRYTFPACAVLTTLAFGAHFGLYRRFMALGGPRRYAAPE